MGVVACLLFFLGSVCIQDAREAFIHNLSLDSASFEPESDDYMLVLQRGLFICGPSLINYTLKSD